MTPVEMLGYVEFPAIERQPYRLTLAPYSFLWLELQRRAEPAEASAGFDGTGATQRNGRMGKISSRARAASGSRR